MRKNLWLSVKDIFFNKFNSRFQFFCPLDGRWHPNRIQLTNVLPIINSRNPFSHQKYICFSNLISSFTAFNVKVSGWYITYNDPNLIIRTRINANLNVG